MVDYKKSIRLLFDAWQNMLRNSGMEVAGYLSFLSIVALFPFIIVLASVAGWLGQGDMGHRFIALMMHHLPSNAVESLRPRIWEIMNGPPQGVLTVSIFGALWTASSAVEGIRAMLNRAYDVRERPPYFIRRIISILQILLLTVLVIVTMSVMVFAPLILQFIGSSTGIIIPDIVEHFFTRDFIYLGTLMLFAAVMSLYYWLPNIRLHLRSVWPGAALVVVLWVLGAALLSFYLDKLSNVNLIYGSLSSVIITMLFFYVMNVIFIYGAEFNHQLMVKFGHKIIEKEKPMAKTPGRFKRKPKKV